jgi:stage II sporulation protein R
MKKIAIVLYMFLLAIGVLVNVYGQQTEAGANAEVVIPQEAVRLRILANSDSSEDQALKRKVRDAVNEQINQWVQNLRSFDEAKRVIQAHVPDIEQTVERVLKEEGSDQSYKVEFNKVHFPTKIYGNYIYPAGEYEAVLITLGAGKGANWWCVLFPPLCFLDFSNGEAVQQEAAREAQDDERAPLATESTESDDRDQPALSTSGPSSEMLPSESFVVEEKEEQVEVKFFVLEALEKLLP